MANTNGNATKASSLQLGRSKLVVTNNGNKPRIRKESSSKKKVKNGTWQVVKPHRSMRVRKQQTVNIISNDDIVDSLDDGSVATETSGKQIKLTDMIAKMKAPSETKKVDLVTLKGKINNPNNKRY